MANFAKHIKYLFFLGVLAFSSIYSMEADEKNEKNDDLLEFPMQIFSKTQNIFLALPVEVFEIITEYLDIKDLGLLQTFLKKSSSTINRFSINEKRAKKIIEAILAKLHSSCNRSNQFEYKLAKKNIALTKDFPNYTMLHMAFSNFFLTGETPFNPHIELYLNREDHTSFLDGLMDLPEKLNRELINNLINNLKTIDNDKLLLMVAKAKKQINDKKPQYYCGLLCSYFILFFVPLFLVHLFHDCNPSLISSNTSLTCPINPHFLIASYIFTIYYIYLIREIGSLTGITSAFLIIIGYIGMSINYQGAIAILLAAAGFCIPMFKRMLTAIPYEYDQKRLKELEEIMKRIKSSKLNTLPTIIIKT